MKKILPYLAIALIALPLFANAQMVRRALSSSDIEIFLDRVANWLYIIGLAIVIVVIVIGGILYLTAGGSEDQIGKAKKTIVNGLIGGIIVLLAGVIVDTIKRFVESNLIYL